MSIDSNIVKKFQEDGFAVIENFLTEDECDRLCEKSKDLIEHKLNLQDHPKTIFKADSTKIHDDYFLSSQDKIRFFLEEGAFDEKGQLIYGKQNAVNKIGHGLHHVDELYKKATFHPIIQAYLKEVGFVEPVVVQSMVIFKQPKIGGVVTPHQDGTFLMSTPSKLVGVWIALEDADLENGCLYFIPGSHSRPITRYMIRNPDSNGAVTIFKGSDDVYDESAFVPVPVKKGSAIIIHGHVVHKSEKNLSSRSREIYTFHVAETYNTEWSAKNWIQPTGHYQFPKVYSNS